MFALKNIAVVGESINDFNEIFHILKNGSDQCSNYYCDYTKGYEF